ncbi:MAG: UDP-N-acetylmuramate dehydrogenase [Verrucomicrobiota bacterium]|nr:UDP-N-acetylmuramate dehydrogenase [Verrucomicrobiota bacterium]
MATVNTTLAFEENIPLAPHTTIGLGGKARYYASCHSTEMLKDVLQAAKDKNLPVHVLGGGSNTIFPDNGFSGLVIKVALKGMQFVKAEESIIARIAAGENWDDFVERAINDGFSGVECLSGIPGFVGATPIQNVGAYGQEVKDSIIQVKAIDRQSLDEVVFSNADCRFSYRQSRFKKDDADKYIVTEVSFRLTPEGTAQIKYPELKKYLESTIDLSQLPPGKIQLQELRKAVITLRKKKSMVVDPTDPNTKSVGSFFLNPIVSKDEFERIKGLWKESGHTNGIPVFDAATGVKIPAAWLIANAGFEKGQRLNGAKISDHHSLALVNCGGTTADIVALAALIRGGVHKVFGIHLEQEPIFVTE